MYAMQYEIALPADYDMTIVHERVRARGALLDALPGLGLKAYCVRERGAAGSPVNAYAPFYLWHSASAMGAFLWGAGFRGLCASFGRPMVRHWTGVAFVLGPARADAPAVASRCVELVAPDADVPAVVDRAATELRDRGQDANVHSAAVAIDPNHWELVRFTLWRSDAAPAGEVVYRVLHLSSPGLAELSSAAARSAYPEVR
ncbi:MAG: DUF4865 family protein [Gemmatimonadaceae bacterium]